jgi:hypothetical protein
MRWREELYERLKSVIPGGYSAQGEIASEPTALGGLALLAIGKREAASNAAQWLAEHQDANGSVGVTSSQSTPGWTTSLAILLWQAMSEPPKYGGPLERAVAWSLNEHGKREEQRDFIGHDTTLLGWSWAANTHSWAEPTAMFVLALKAVGQSNHPRTREAVRLLVNRLLPHGGCNYGNTFVLGQELMPHVQPTGIVMMALAGENVDDPRLEKSLAYLKENLSAETTTASLTYGLLGLAAHRRAPTDRFAWLESSYNRVDTRGASPYKIALLALAASDSTILWQNST